MREIDIDSFGLGFVFHCSFRHSNTQINVILSAGADLR